MPSFLSVIVRTSTPSAIPVNGNPNAYVFTVSTIFKVEGCCCDSFAVPSLTFNIKADESKSPVPSNRGNTFSLKVTSMFELSAASFNSEMMGAF